MPVNEVKEKLSQARFRMTFARKKVVWAYIFLAIPIVFFAYIRVYPALFAFQMSLHDYNPLAAEQPFVGFENYEKLFSELGKRKSQTKSAFQNTINYVLARRADSTLPGAGDLLDAQRNPLHEHAVSHHVLFALRNLDDRHRLGLPYVVSAALRAVQCHLAARLPAAATLSAQHAAGAAVSPGAGHLARHGLRHHHILGGLEADSAHLLRSG